MTRRSHVLIGVLCWMLLASAGSCSGSKGSPELWLSDFEKLKTELAAGYANLEWTVRHNDIDVAALVQDTEEQLGRTTSARKARKIIGRFLDAFNDPHLRAKHTDPPTDTPASGGSWMGLANTASSKEALDAFGYRRGKYDFGVDFESLDGFERLPDGDNPFPAGILRFEDGRKFGIIRIKYFGEDRYYDAAERTWEEFRSEFDGTCDRSCWWQFTLDVRARLMEYLAARLDERLLDDDVPNHNGAYYSQNSILYPDRKDRPGGWPMESPNPLARDERLAERLYEASCRLVGLA